MHGIDTCVGVVKEMTVELFLEQRALVREPSLSLARTLSRSLSRAA